MYPYYAKWIRSHRDLPLRLNQWNSVVRWEAKQTTPFLRAREFLWQEGHTAHLTEELSAKEVMEILELYAGVYEQLLAVPVVRGKKTEAEKFAGGHWTTTCEAYIPTNGRGIQGATSHCLGQNFSKMFDITVENPEQKGQKIHVWQNSWGLSTRVIGVMVMIHGDDKGLVLPPRISKIQTIFVPVGITAKVSAEDKEAHYKRMDELAATLKKAGVRSDIDLRDGYTPAWKFNDWEMKGVPVRLEFGPKDAAKDVVTYVCRDTGEKGTIDIAELGTKGSSRWCGGCCLVLPRTNTTESQCRNFSRPSRSGCMTRLMLRSRSIDCSSRTGARWFLRWTVCRTRTQVPPHQVANNATDKNVVIIPFCEEIKCEDRIKELTKSDAVQEGPDGKPQPSMGMKSLCIPFDQV